MAATFPNGVKSFTTKQADDNILPNHVNDLQDEVIAIETELRKTAAGTSVVDHGALSGLNDDDHPQYVNRTTNQTIAGVKTFSAFPATPSSAPTANYQVANKKYVDDVKGLYRKMTRVAVFNNVTLANNHDTDYLATTYGVPAGASAIYILMQVQSATVGAQLILSEGGTHGDSASQLVVAANQGNKVTGIVPLSEDGKFNIWAPSGELKVWLYISGYFT